MKRFRLFLLVLSIASVSVFVSCTDDGEVTSDCSGCSSDNPYSTTSSSTCYATLTACNDAETGTCSRCD